MWPHMGALGSVGKTVWHSWVASPSQEPRALQVVFVPGRERWTLVLTADSAHRLLPNTAAPSGHAQAAGAQSGEGTGRAGQSSGHCGPCLVSTVSCRLWSHLMVVGWVGLSSCPRDLPRHQPALCTLGGPWAWVQMWSPTFLSCEVGTIPQGVAKWGERGGGAPPSCSWAAALPCRSPIASTSLSGQCTTLPRWMWEAQTVSAHIRDRCLPWWEAMWLSEAGNSWSWWGCSV